MESNKIIPKGLLFPFILLTTLFFAWAVPNNLTDTMLAAFKRIMSMSDSKTAWIQVVCYLLGYGCCAVPGALFIKKYTYKSGVMLGLGLYALGALLFYPAMLSSGVNIDFSLNLSQAFNPFGAITGVVISQIFILSQLNGMTATERAQLPVEELAAIQGQELNAVTTAYVLLGLLMLALLLVIRFTKMPNLSEKGEKVEFAATLRRLIRNKNYVWGVVAQFFNIGAQIAVWSFVIRYAMVQLDFDGVLASLGDSASADAVVNALRGIEPVAAMFYDGCEWFGLDDLLPRTAEQAGATYYIMSLILFVIMRFVCTVMMKYVRAYKILIGLALLAVIFCLGTMLGKGSFGVYCLMGISGCMSLMFPTIYGFGLTGLGNDTKIGGSFMVMAIAGAAVLTQIQGIVSDQTGSIMAAYVVPGIAFAVIAYYGFFIARKQELTTIK